VAISLNDKGDGAIRPMRERDFPHKQLASGGLVSMARAGSFGKGTGERSAEKIFSGEKKPSSLVKHTPP